MIKKTKKLPTLGIVEAVETLSSIAELDLSHDLGAVKEHELELQGEIIPYKTVHWVGSKEPSEALAIVQDNFKVVLDYLKSFYEKEYSHLDEPKTIEEIKTIMVLVGEAANKLDKYHSFFKKIKVEKASDLPEFKKLQRLYHKQISKKKDNDFINSWLKHLPQQVDDRISNISLRGRKKVTSKHAFVDLDAVKRDEIYELFFIRKENGTRYFNPKLIRNIKLVYDFERFFSNNHSEDPLSGVEHWNDKVMLLSAQKLLSQSDLELQYFFYQLKNKKKLGKIGKLLQKSILALMLAANSDNLLSTKPVKSCSSYFRDFQYFFRKLLSSDSYQKMGAYPPKKNDHYHLAQMELVQSLAQALYKDLDGLHKLCPVVQEVIENGGKNQEASKKQNDILESLKRDYKALSNSLKKHREGPLAKVLKLMQKVGNQTFDTILQENLPTHQYTLFSSDGPISCLRIPSPTRQEFIHRARVTPEFISFLRSYSRRGQKRKHLIVNLQDRTSWREHLRSTTLEELGRYKDFKDSLSVVTIAKSTDFYQQRDVYSKINNIKQFKDLLFDQIKDDQGGYYFPISVKRKLFVNWMEEIFDVIHCHFFDKKNVLSRKSRMAFIDIFHWFLELKLIDLLKVDSFSLTCKDGVDTSQVESVGMFFLLKMINGKEMTQKDLEYIETLLFAPALMIRQRNVLPERVERMLAAVLHIQDLLLNKKNQTNVKSLHEAFAPLYETCVLNSIPQKE